MKLKSFILGLFLLLVAVPAMAVFEERDLARTLAVLRFELKQECEKLEAQENNLHVQDESIHERLISMIKKCEELSLMLYSQNQNFTFDMTYALKEVSREYEKFLKDRLPYDDIVGQLDSEIDRYSRLIESLQKLPAAGERRRPRSEADSLRRFQSGDSLGRHMPAPSAAASRPERRMFQLDADGKADRDSCLVYAGAILDFYTEAREHILSDNEFYDNVSSRLKESYDYAQDRYRMLQKKMFTQTQDNYLAILRAPKSYIKMAWEELSTKYNRRQDDASSIRSEWRGPVVSGFILLVLLCLALATVLSAVIVRLLTRSVKHVHSDGFKRRKPLLMALFGLILFLVALSVVSLTVRSNFIVQASSILFAFCWLLVAVISSLLIRIAPDNLRHGFSLYLPAILIGLTVITFRIMFIPNRAMNLLLPLLLIVFFVWQAAACRKYVRRVELSDDITSCITLVVLFVTAVLSLFGNVFLSLLIIIWWLFLLACIETLIALYRLFQGVKARKMNVSLDALRHSQLTKSAKGDNIRSTWLLDFFEMVVLPVASVASLPISILIALKVFDLQEIFADLYSSPFVNLHDAGGAEMLKISIRLLVVVTGLFFVFRYIAYFVRSMYKDIRYRKIQELEGKRHIRSNEVNLTLARNIIGMIVWGAYVILIFLLFKIPTGAISIVFAGLATGLGLAMKDILNNFIYGIQLMSGRLRVGDWVDCDGVRGKVIAISYQSTQIETLDGAVMSFLNTALFNKNFKNLTKNNPYEFIKIIVGVSYGTDIEKVRMILHEAVSALDPRDSYGRRIVDDKAGVTVVFDDFGDSSVNLAVKQYVLVSQRNSYIALAKETIYNVLKDNGISIPFPQRDIHIIQDGTN